MVWQDGGGSLGLSCHLKSWMKIACLRSIDTQYSIIRLGKSIKSVWFPSSGPGELHKGQRLVAKGKRALTLLIQHQSQRPHLAGLQEASGSSQGLAKRDQLSSLKKGSDSGCMNFWPSWKMHRKQDGRALGSPWNFLWPVESRPGDQAGMRWERLWLIPNGTSGILVNVQTREEV